MRKLLKKSQKLSITYLLPYFLLLKLKLSAFLFCKNWKQLVFLLLRSQSTWGTFIRYLLRFFDCLAHPNLSVTLATDQKLSLSCLPISYIPKFSRVLATALYVLYECIYYLRTNLTLQLCDFSILNRLCNFFQQPAHAFTTVAKQLASKCWSEAAQESRQRRQQEPWQRPRLPTTIMRYIFSYLYQTIENLKKLKL